MAWLMMQYLSGGAWGVMIRRVAEAAAKTIPIWLVLFIPSFSASIPYTAIAGLIRMWWRKDPVLQHKAAYLNANFWIARAYIYMVGWSLLAFLLNRWSDREDREGGVRPRAAHGKDFRAPA